MSVGNVVKGDFFLQAIRLVLPTEMSSEICQIVRAYASNPHEEAVERYILENCYRYKGANDFRETEAAFQRFVAEQKIDLNNVVCLDLSGLHCPENEDHWGARDTNESCAYLSDNLLEWCLAAVPNLQELKVTHNPRIAVALSYLHFSQEERARCKIETIDVSHNSAFGDKEFMKCCLESSHRFPQLKKIIVSGCPINPTQKTKVREEKPLLTIIG